MNISFCRATCLATLVAGAFLLSACGGGDAAPSGNGKVSLNLTDAPVDSAQSVVVQFSGVAFKREGEAAETITTINPSPQSIDLLQYQGGQVALLLNNMSLPAGNYEWVRLMVNAEANVRDSYLVPAAGGECELLIPSGAQSGLKLNRGFTLPADGSVALTVDFDLRQSIHAPPGQTSSGACTQGYILRPTLRLVDNANVGAIAGTVDAALVPVGCTPAVYIFSGSNVTPDDIEDTTSASTDVDPLVTAKVDVVNGATQYSYKAAFIPTGTYTVAFTCGTDDPTADDTLVFTGMQNVTVQNNLISSANFTSVPSI